MYVVYNTATGWSDESMRFAREADALAYIHSPKNEPIEGNLTYRIED